MCSLYNSFDAHPKQQSRSVTTDTGTDLPQDALRVFQDYAFASYQIWACPGSAIFADTRIERYDGALWADYFAISQGRYDWEEVAERYRVTHLFLDPDQQAQAVRAASSSTCWSEIYQDPAAVIFAKQRPCP